MKIYSNFLKKVPDTIINMSLWEYKENKSYIKTSALQHMQLSSITIVTAHDR